MIDEGESIYKHGYWGKLTRETHGLEVAWKNEMTTSSVWFTAFRLAVWITGEDFSTENPS